MSDFSRRHFLKSAAMATGLAALGAQKARAQENDSAAKGEKSESGKSRAGHVSGGEVLRVGLIGAGGRATGAAIDCVHSSDNVHIVAIGDAFMDRAEGGWEKLKKKIPEACKVTRENLFDGFDNYKKVLASDIDLVIIATPPGFRPIHLAAAVEAGKHIFAEKPVAVDPAGIRSVIETAKKAKEKGLAIGVGTQRRHHKVYQEIMKRIQDGAIGDVVGGQCYWMQNGLWVRERQPGWSDMEWQMRNWLYFDWASGDHIVEQHMHNIDVMNWAMGGPPEKAVSSGARMVRTDPKYGNIYDNFNTEFEWPNGVRIDSKCRQWEGASYRVSERIVGTKGTADPSSEIFGENPWKYEGDFKMRDAYVEEHRVLVDSIRNSKPYNELERVAESCLTAIIGRMAAYTGQMVSYRWALKASKLDLTPEKMEFGPHEINPVPVAGTTKLV